MLLFGAALFVVRSYSDVTFLVLGSIYVLATGSASVELIRLARCKCTAFIVLTYLVSEAGGERGAPGLPMGMKAAPPM